ncbi:hypothetical protein [uncultured Cytophaga sp.]|uniref:hypothetical protein n=1 Tax=uncultured Cytophaga sp. TaxID=160238 RepID=UPI00260C83D3|nr:hypothetical protein [uncultured Cytophaga sp.]
MRYILIPFIALFILVNATSCNKHSSYPCPGLGQTDEADISQFDENGALKSDSKKKKKKSNVNGRFNVDNGMINKKNPKQLKSKSRKRV